VRPPHIKIDGETEAKIIALVCNEAPPGAAGGPSHYWPGRWSSWVFWTK
jgi:hypothetical protein